MKSIQNKETTITNVDENNKPVGNCRYSHLINLIIRQPVHGGYSYNDIEQRLSIGKAIKDHPETIELELADFNYLKRLINDMKWGFVSEDLIALRDDIINTK